MNAKGTCYRCWGLSIKGKCVRRIYEVFGDTAIWAFYIPWALRTIVFTYNSRCQILHSLLSIWDGNHAYFSPSGYNFVMQALYTVYKNVMSVVDAAVMALSMRICRRNTARKAMHINMQICFRGHLLYWKNNNGGGLVQNIWLYVLSLLYVRV